MTQAPSASIAVIIATKGRPALVARTLAWLDAGSRRADRIFIVGADDADIARLPADRPDVTAFVGRLGLTRQRNDGLRLARHYDILVFFDDDFVPSRHWLAQAHAIFCENPAVAGLTGRVLADGIHGPGIAFETAMRLVEARDAEPQGPVGFDESFGPYGCNMAFRGAAMADMEFDERLPLYAWLEDADFGARLRHRGRMGRVDALWGVHLGDKNGRERGRRLGYSQIANPIYLSRKGSLSWRFTLPLMARNLLANVARAARPEPHVDRVGRLAGNLVALWETLLGIAAPERAPRL